MYVDERKNEFSEKRTITACEIYRFNDFFFYSFGLVPGRGLGYEIDYAYIYMNFHFIEKRVEFRSLYNSIQ